MGGIVFVALIALVAFRVGRRRGAEQTAASMQFSHLSGAAEDDDTDELLLG